METILNLLWLFVTLGIVGVWTLRWLPERRRPRARAFREAIALVCALALLFPAVSLTDDLHPQIVAVEAASGKRNACRLFSQPSHSRVAAAGKSLHKRISLDAVLPLGLAQSELAAGDLPQVFGSISLSSRAIARRDRSPPVPSALLRVASYSSE